MRRPAPNPTWLVLAAALVACSDEGPGISPTDVAGDVATDAFDVAAADAPDTIDVAAQPDTGPSDVKTDTGPDVTGPTGPCGVCAGGLLCDETDGTCKECISNANCVPPKWCQGGACNETLCFPGARDCEGQTPKVCSGDGTKWVYEDACGEDDACDHGSCKPKVCEPGQKKCDKLQIQLCGEEGTGWAHVPCPPGAACYVDGCEPIKHNVVLIFDTSGSMGSIGLLDTVPCVCPEGCKAQPYPACEDMDCPQSRLGLAKKVFKEIFNSPVFQGVNFAMTRFPQREKASSSEKCGDLFDPSGVGHYTNLSSAGGNSNWITGDDGAHITPDGSWYDENLDEVLCVPFPKSYDDDTATKAIEWVDGNEVFEGTGVECEKNVDCEVGVCAVDKQTGIGECATHTNHELRATGNTPLGKSLFYAGEYLRKYIVVEGKACEVDADCANVNYFCSPDKKCYDPLRGCRQNVIVLFTDGVEEPPTELTDFFNPGVQAKRFHYGLGCAFHTDCLNTAKCKTGSCQEYGASQPITLIDGGAGANHLTDYNGDAISATVHVVDISMGSSDSSNMAIAQHGGGVFYPVTKGDPSELLDSINSILDVKANLSQCIPQFPPGVE